MERQVQLFKATEEDGTEHTIQIVRGFHEVVGELGQIKMSENELLEMRTEDGRFVQQCKGGFEIIDGMERIMLTSSDPNAPDD